MAPQQMVNVEGNHTSDSALLVKEALDIQGSQDELGNLLPSPEPQVPFSCTFQPGMLWERLITAQKTSVIVFIKL